MTDRNVADNTQLNPRTHEEATIMLQNIADRMDQLNAEYRQLQLQAAWLQGWLANHTAKVADAHPLITEAHPKKKR